MKGFDKENYNKMVAYIKRNVGGAISLYTPKKNEYIEHPEGGAAKVVRACKDLDELRVMVFRYLEGYNNYPDLPIIEYNNEKTILFIKKSYNERRN